MSISVDIVSPTPGVANGEPGGFSRNYQTAKNTAIVLDVTGLTPGVGYLTVIARLYSDDEANPTEEVVYRRDNFRGLYVRSSSKSSLETGFRFSVKRYGGWPSNSQGSVGHIAFAVDVVDGDGNLL